MDTNQKSLLARGGMIVGGIVVLAVVLPIVWYAFLSALGIFGMGILTVLGLGIFKALPLLGQKWENKLLGWRKAEARANPIEQMQNRMLEKRQHLDASRDALSNISAQIKGLDRMVQEQIRRDPTYDAKAQRDAIVQMQNFYQGMCKKVDAADKALDDLKVQIDRKKFEWEFAHAGQAAAAAMNSQDADAMLKDMLADEAFHEVEKQFDKTFAALEVDTMKLTNAKQIEFAPGITLDATAINITDKVKA